nr:sac3 family protein 1 [Quercus suber]
MVERTYLLVHILRLRPTVVQLRQWHNGVNEAPPPSANGVKEDWASFLKSLAPASIFDDMPDIDGNDQKRDYRGKLLDSLYTAAYMEEMYCHASMYADEYYHYEEEEKRVKPCMKRPLDDNAHHRTHGNVADVESKTWSPTLRSRKRSRKSLLHSSPKMIDRPLRIREDSSVILPVEVEPLHTHLGAEDHSVLRQATQDVKHPTYQDSPRKISEDSLHNSATADREWRSTLTTAWASQQQNIPSSPEWSKMPSAFATSATSSFDTLDSDQVLRYDPCLTEFEHTNVPSLRDFSFNPPFHYQNQPQHLQVNTAHVSVPQFEPTFSPTGTSSFPFDLPMTPAFQDLFNYTPNSVPPTYPAPAPGMYDISGTSGDGRQYHLDELDHRRDSAACTGTLSDCVPSSASTHYQNPWGTPAHIEPNRGQATHGFDICGSPATFMFHGRSGLTAQRSDNNSFSPKFLPVRRNFQRYCPCGHQSWSPLAGRNTERQATSVPSTNDIVRNDADALPDAVSCGTSHMYVRSATSKPEAAIDVTGLASTRSTFATAPAPARGTSARRGQGFGGPQGNALARGALNQSSRGQPIRGRGNRVAKPTEQSNGVAAARGSWQERYQALTKAREVEREQAIAKGILAHPDKRRTLAEAVTPVGTCMDMCPEYERAERVVQRDDPSRSAYGAADQEPDESRMVKKFHRPDAGAQEQLPSDLRPPLVLKQTVKFLFEDVLANATSLGKVHGFIWDRTRGVRNDFSIQQVTKPEDVQIAIDCYERIVRFHILSLHQLSVEPPISDKFSPFQEREQLDATLLSLMSFYDGNRGRTAVPNEGEFRAYFILFHLQDPDVEDRAQSWPISVLGDNRVQEALRLYAAACNKMDRHGPLSPFATQAVAQQDWQRFWALVGSKRVSYLMACAAEIYFNLIRRTVLNAIWRAYRARAKVSPESFTVDYLSGLLCLDSDDEVYRFCELYGFSFKDTTNATQCLDLTSVAGTSLVLPKGEVKQTKSDLVEDKRFGRTLPSIINGYTVKQAQDAGLTVVEDLEEDMDDVIEAKTDHVAPHATEVPDAPEDDGESLFIPENHQPTPNTNTEASDSSAPTNRFMQGPAPTKSPFAGFSGFGKPSSAFGAPSNNTTNLGVSGIFSGSSKAPENATSEVKPLGFNFMSASTDANTNASGQSGPPQQSSFSFTKPSPSPASNFFKCVGSTPAQDDAAISQESNFLFKQPTSTTPFFSWNAPKLPETSDKISDAMTSNPGLPASTSDADAPQSSNPGKVASSPFTFGHVTRPSVNTTNGASPSGPPPPPPQPPIATSAPFIPAPPAPPQISQQAPTEQPSRRTSLANFQPRKPSPLSHSFGPEENENRFSANSTVSKLSKTESAPSNTVSVPEVKASIPTAPAPPSRAAELEEQTNQINRLGTDLCLEPDTGYLRQFIEFAVEQTILQVQEKIYVERVNKEADTFRWSVLAHRYLKRWRDLAWRKRVASKGRARRQRAQQALRESKTPSEMGNVLGSSAASVAGSSHGFNLTKREEVDAMFQNTIPNGTTPKPKALLAGKSTLKTQEIGSTEPQSVQKQVSESSNVDRKKRKRESAPATDPHADLMKRSSFLGFAMDRSGARRGSTTKTNYFRLKAMGITPELRPAIRRGTKRQRDRSVDSASSVRSPNKKQSSPLDLQESTAVQAPAFAPRTSSAADDDALFARLKAAREKLQESAAFLKSETVKGEQWRQSVSSNSIYESPSMARARAEVRLLASQSEATLGAHSPARDVPAYWLRESRFVPREHYAKAIERSHEFRKSRSRDDRPPVVGHADNALNVRSPTVGREHRKPNFQQQEQLDPKLDGIGTSQSLKPSDLSSPPQVNGQASSTLSYKPPNGLPAAEESQTLLSSTVVPTNAALEQQFGQLDSFPELSQPSFQSSEQPSFRDFNFTMKPWQVDQSLSNSFGVTPNSVSQASSFQTAHQHQADSATLQRDDFMQPSQPSWEFDLAGNNTTLSAPNSSFVHSEVLSQAASQANLLVSDGDSMVPQPAVDQVAEIESVELLDGDTEEDSVVDDTEEDDGDYRSYGHNNPFAALAADDDEQSEDASQEPRSYDDYDEVEEDDVEVNGHRTHGESDLEHGYTEEEEEEDDYSEEESADEDENEEGPRAYAQAGHGFLAQSYGQQPAYPPNDALKAVGNTQEEAIELSD